MGNEGHSVLQQSDIRWASRWDTYLLMTDDQIHWFSIINSLMIVLFLSGMVAMIMMRTLHRDISKCAARSAWRPGAPACKPASG